MTDYEYLGFAKVVNYFDEQIQMLHKEYARQLLTHRNPYTGNEYRHEPAVAIVELVNENSIVEAWFSDRLLGKNTQKNPGTWTDITACYAEELTEKYNAWLARDSRREDLRELRRVAGVAEGEPIPRLIKAQFKDGPRQNAFTPRRRSTCTSNRRTSTGMCDYLQERARREVPDRRHERPQPRQQRLSAAGLDLATATSSTATSTGSTRTT